MKNAGAWTAERTAEPVLGRAALSEPVLFPDVHETNATVAKSVQDDIDQLEQTTTRLQEISLRVNSIVSTANSPEYHAAVTTVQENTTAIQEIQRGLQAEYARLFRKHGAHRPNLLAEDAFERAHSEHPEYLDLMTIKRKTRGVDSTAINLAADDAATDPEVLTREARQAELLAELKQAIRVRDQLGNELRSGDDARLELVREGYNLQRTAELIKERLLSDRVTAGISKALAAKAPELGFTNAAVIDPADVGSYPVHQDADGRLNLLVWDDTTGWKQAVSFAPFPGNVSTGAKIGLEDGAEALWLAHANGQGPATGARRVAVIEPAPGTKKLGREDGWFGLVTTIDSSD